jgi:pSer/pThr/pTyr-binding forkhead associated (FHA) protein
MPARVTLTVVAGEPQGREYVFSERTVGAIGRAADCLVQVPSDLPHLNVSRHHCLLDIDPPQVEVRDLGSRNGTFLNGEIIGRRTRIDHPEAAGCLTMPSFCVEDGDELRVGDTVFRVTVSVWDEERKYQPDDSEIGEMVFG